MATTGTYDFALETVDVIEEAFERCGRDPQELNNRHIRSAIRSLNLLGIEIENDADLPFRMDRITQAITESLRGFYLPVGTIDVLSAYLVRTNNSVESAQPMRRAPIEQLEQLSREQDGTPVQWAISKALPGERSLIVAAATAGAAEEWGADELESGSPTHRYAFVFWQASDRDDDKITYYRLRSAQDIESLSDQPDYARNWLEAICAGLAAKLALKWAPDRLAALTLQWEAQKKNAQRGGRSRDEVMIFGRGFGNRARRRRW